jgi:hypothetical protein
MWSTFLTAFGEAKQELKIKKLHRLNDEALKRPKEQRTPTRARPNSIQLQSIETLNQKRHKLESIDNENNGKILTLHKINLFVLK